GLGGSAGGTGTATAPSGRETGCWRQRTCTASSLCMRGEHLVQGCLEILEQMKTVGYLRGRRRPLANTVRIGWRAFSGNDRDPRMLPEPLRQGRGTTLWQERHGLAALQIDERRPTDGCASVRFYTLAATQAHVLIGWQLGAHTHSHVDTRP